jgi:hypothetical protein
MPADETIPPPVAIAADAPPEPTDDAPEPETPDGDFMVGVLAELLAEGAFDGDLNPADE